MNLIKRYIFQNVLPFIGRACVRKNKYCNVVYYHDVVRGAGETFMQINIDVFKEQMMYLVQGGYETLRFDDLADHNKLKFQKKRVLITFDDGWLSNYAEIFDFMQHYGIKYNVFLTVGEIGNNVDYLSWAQVRKMHESGVVGFGVHTFTHADMSDLQKVDVEQEINVANNVFKEQLGEAPKDFCYPFGYYSEEGNHIIESMCCYNHIYTSRMMYSYKENGTVIFGRNSVNNDWSLKVFKHQVEGYYNVLGTFIK